MLNAFKAYMLIVWTIGAFGIGFYARHQVQPAVDAYAKVGEWQNVIGGFENLLGQGND